MDNRGVKELFSEYLFWDYDTDKIELQNDKILIIERVATKGLEKDWNTLTEIYGLEIIKNSVIKLPYLDPKTLNYLSFLFDIPKEQFKCYTKMRLRKSYWNSQNNSRA
jgi:hypothetical protein